MNDRENNQTEVRAIMDRASHILLGTSIEDTRGMAENWLHRDLKTSQTSEHQQNENKAINF
jgi:hypothetical protein